MLFRQAEPALIEAPTCPSDGTDGTGPAPRPPSVANPCVHCGRSCPAHDLAESIPLGGGKWEHLTCWLRAEKAGGVHLGSPGGDAPAPPPPDADDGDDGSHPPEEAVP
jgi:hypothetical protein